MQTVGGFLIFFGLVALVIAVVGLVKQRLAWTRVIATRRDAGFLLLGALVVMTLGAACQPSTPATTSTSAVDSAPPVATSTTQSQLATTEPTLEAVVPQTTTPPPARVAAPEVTTPAPAPEQTVAAAAPAPLRTSAPTVTVPRQRSATSRPTPAYTPPSTANTYTNVDGKQVERPDGNTSGATAKCRDGSYSHSLHHSGTCSGHGGVAQWL